MASHSSTLAWKIPWTEELERLQSMGLLRVGHDRATSLSLFTFMHWRKKGQPIPVFLPGESQGQGSLVGCRLWGCTESDTTEATQQKQQHTSTEVLGLGVNRDQIAQHLLDHGKKAREFQKNIYFCFIDYAKAFDCGSQKTVENSERNGNTMLKTCLISPSYEIFGISQMACGARAIFVKFKMTF